jgi:hypothetical protein
MSESELISKMTANTAENNIDNNQDMEIDILQVRLHISGLFFIS